MALLGTQFAGFQIADDIVKKTATSYVIAWIIFIALCVCVTNALRMRSKAWLTAAEHETALSPVFSPLVLSLYQLVAVTDVMLSSFLTGLFAVIVVKYVAPQTVDEIPTRGVAFVLIVVLACIVSSYVFQKKTILAYV